MRRTRAIYSVTFLYSVWFSSGCVILPSIGRIWRIASIAMTSEPMTIPRYSGVNVGFILLDSAEVKAHPTHMPRPQASSDTLISGMSDSIITVRFICVTVMPPRRSVTNERRRSSNPPVVAIIKLAIATNSVTPIPA